MTQIPNDGRSRHGAQEGTLQADYDALIARHVAAGWSEGELALAMERLAQEHIGNLARHEASELSTAARYQAQFSDLPVGDAEPPSVHRKVLAYGALIIVAGVLVALLGALVAI